MNNRRKFYNNRYRRTSLGSKIAGGILVAIIVLVVLLVKFIKENSQTFALAAGIGAGVLVIVAIIAITVSAKKKKQRKIEQSPEHGRKYSKDDFDY